MLPRHKKITRRDFLKVSFTAGGALLVGTFLDACASPTPILPTHVPTLSPTATAIDNIQPPISDAPFQPNAFIRIDPDGKITFTIHRSEMGQGVRTSLAMILAEELEVNWETIHVEQMDVNIKFNQVTSGSGSVTESYSPLRNAGAKAKHILVSAAAQFWGVPFEECAASQGEVVHTATGKHLGYGSLVGIAANLKVSTLPQKKNPKDFRLIGNSMPRVDEPDIVTGKAIYGLDVRVPGMLFAVVARCPVPGGKLVDYDSTQAESVAGVRQVVKISNGVAVVAQNTWAAIQGRAALKINWDEGANATLSTESIRKALAQAPRDDIAKEEPSSLTSLEAVYETPFLAHATMEPPTCVADVRADRCEIWAPTQNPLDVQGFVQKAINVPTNVHVTLLGGGFGRKLEVDFPVEAAEISKAVGAPVQLTWTREDDIQHDFYRQITYHVLKAGWDESGNLQQWRHYMAAPGINGIAYRAGLDVLEEGLDVLYRVSDDNLSKAYVVDTPMLTGPWRAVMSAPNAFANECFLDEMAAALKKDTYEFRLGFLAKSSALHGVLELAATKANWGIALPAGYGRGIAAQVYHDSLVAMVAEASVLGGTVQVHKVVCAVDCGRVIHPDMVAQQIEGSIVFGLTSMFNEITYKQGRVQQSNFYDYPILQMSEMPEVEVYIVPSEKAPQGLGEMGVPPIVPAVLNAVFNATGIRIRHTPIRPEDLQTG